MNFQIFCEGAATSKDNGARPAILHALWLGGCPAPYLHMLLIVSHLQRGSTKHSQTGAEYAGSQSMPDLGRPAHIEWKERDITIVPDGDKYVVKMPSVLTPAQGPQQNAKNAHGKPK